MFYDWLWKTGIIRALLHSRKIILYVDICSGHEITDNSPSLLEKGNTELCYFPKNATHLDQPAGSIIIHKVKQVWTSCWEEQKVGLIKKVKGTNASCKLQTPRKQYFLRITAATVHVVNYQRDKNGLTYAQKSKISARWHWIWMTTGRRVSHFSSCRKLLIAIVCILTAC